jgi:predicted DNA-binding protein
MKVTRVAKSISFPPELAARLETFADRHYSTVSSVVQQGVEAILDGLVDYSPKGKQVYTHPSDT